MNKRGGWNGNEADRNERQSPADIKAMIEASLPADSEAEYGRLCRIGHDGHKAWCRINHVGDRYNCGTDNPAEF